MSLVIFCLLFSFVDYVPVKGEIIWYLSLTVWLISLNIMLSSSIHAVGSLFILMLFSLAMQKLFILMRSHLFILSFMSFTLGDISVKILLRGISEIFLAYVL